VKSAFLAADQSAMQLFREALSRASRKGKLESVADGGRQTAWTGT